MDAINMVNHCPQAFILFTSGAYLKVPESKNGRKFVLYYDVKSFASFFGIKNENIIAGKAI